MIYNRSSFEISHHAKQRMIERDIKNPNEVFLKLVKNAVRKEVQKRCVKNGYKHKNVYFRTTEKPYSIYVTTNIDINKYLVVTAFKLI